MRSPVDSVSSASTPRSPPTASPTDGVITTTSVVSTVNAVVLALPEMRGKRGELLRAVAALAAAGEINVEFRLGHDRLSVIFDPADLRRLPAGVTLQQDDDARLAAKGHKPRGRPRGGGW